MAAIVTSQFLDGGTARTAGEAHAIGAGAVLTIRTDSRIHANAPASFTGSLGNPTFTDIGGELLIDARNVRWLAYTGGSGNAPAVGTSIVQGVVSGYYLGCWASLGSAPVAVGAAIPASGFIKLREITGGAYAAGALTGIAATAAGADVPGWIEIVWDAGTNFVVGRVGKITTRGEWFELGTTNGALGQTLTIPTSSSASTNNFCPGCWVETAAGSGVFEFWTGLSSAANGWVRTSLGFAEGYTDKRGRFVKTFGNGQIQFGEAASMTGTYATVAGQASTYADISIAGTYTWAGGVVTVNTNATQHEFSDGQSVYLDFTSGGATPDGTYVVTVLDPYNFSVALAGSGASGNVTIRPGVLITFTAHGYMEGEQVYCDFTTGTGVDGTYPIYAITAANTYRVAYPHAAALTGGNVTVNGRLQCTLTAHGHAIGNEVYLDFTTGGATNGRYIARAVAANTIDINYPFSAAITTSNVTAKWTIGHVPPTGCKVRVPNVFWAECAIASRQTNSVPNATIASRPEFTTATAGAIDLEKLYTLSGRSIFDQAYSVRLVDCAFSESLQVTECATPLDISNVGVGMYSAQDARALQLTSNFAGGTVANGRFMRATTGSSDYAGEIAFCAGLALNSVEFGGIAYTRTTGAVPLYINGSRELTFNGVKTINGPLSIATSSKIAVNDYDYTDRFIGHATSTTPFYAMQVAAGCTDIVFDGVTFGFAGAIPDCQPNGLVNLINVLRAKVRNVGSAASYAKCSGAWGTSLYGMQYGIFLGGNCDDIKLQKIFIDGLRGALATTANSDKNILLEQVLCASPWNNSAKGARQENMAWLNATVKGLSVPYNTTAAQVSVYGSHFYSWFRGDKFGAITLAMNEPTSETAPYFTSVAGTVLFNSSGGVEMRAIGAQAIWEMPYFAQGHTGFANVAPSISGGTIGNYTFEYQIDTGSGWNGSWKTLNTTNLTAETVTASIGFKLKLRITTTVTNSTAITYVYINTTSTVADQNAIDYPLDTNTVTFTGLPTGCDAVVLEAGTTTVLDQRDSLAATSYSYTYSGAQTVDVGFIKPGYVPFYIRNLALTTSDSSIPVALTPDRNYS